MPCPTRGPTSLEPPSGKQDPTTYGTHFFTTPPTDIFIVTQTKLQQPAGAVISDAPYPVRPGSPSPRVAALDHRVSPAAARGVPCDRKTLLCPTHDPTPFEPPSGMENPMTYGNRFNYVTPQNVIYFLAQATQNLSKDSPKSHQCFCMLSAQMGVPLVHLSLL